MNAKQIWFVSRDIPAIWNPGDSPGFRFRKWNPGESPGFRFTACELKWKSIRFLASRIASRPLNFTFHEKTREISLIRNPGESLSWTWLVPILIAADKHLHEEQLEYKSGAVLLRRIKVFATSEKLHAGRIYYVEGIRKFWQVGSKYCNHCQWKAIVDFHSFLLL